MNAPASLYVAAKTTALADVLKGPRRVQMNLLRTISADARAVCGEALAV